MSAEMGKTAVGYAPVETAGKMVIGAFDDDEDDLEGAKVVTAPPPPKVDQADLPLRQVAFAVGLYAACSSTLLLINKVAMSFVPDASFILFCQFVSSSLTVRFLKCASPDTDIELIRWEKARPFFLACLVFFLCLLANTQALKSVNVETVIVARSCSPIAVSVLEHFTLGRALPNTPGLLSLLAIAGGAVMYVVTDQGFQIEGYTWLLLYFVFIVVEMVFVKFVVDTIPMSTWTRVYYNNTLSIPMVLVSSVLTGFGAFAQVEWGVAHVVMVALSCVVGVAISYAGFNLRKAVSATSFTVIGVLCKLLTVLLNDTVWNNHSNFMGHLGLLVCIAAGFAYERTKVLK
ncbi:GONST3 [Symbiodinium natans]|uniref:GONST3 protein n=1 Tax=Symbiodinium natans TaxID=878477 RepID=A0A812KU32_9DINO|nr:GONST3 [Symbiodinium natans]